jgi:hypothetical protein
MFLLYFTPHLIVVHNFSSYGGWFILVVLITFWCMLYIRQKQRCEKTKLFLFRVAYSFIQSACINKKINTNTNTHTHTLRYTEHVHAQTCTHGDVWTLIWSFVPSSHPPFPSYSYLSLPLLYENNNSFDHHSRCSLSFSFKSCHSVSCSFVLRIVGHVLIYSVSFVTLFREDVTRVWQKYFLIILLHWSKWMDY